MPSREFVPTIAVSAPGACARTHVPTRWRSSFEFSTGRSKSTMHAQGYLDVSTQAVRRLKKFNVNGARQLDKKVSNDIGEIKDARSRVRSHDRGHCDLAREEQYRHRYRLELCLKDGPTYRVGALNAALAKSLSRADG